MINILIIEDEEPAANRLKKMVEELEPGAQVLDNIVSVSSAITWFGQNPSPDLIFSDIQLSDGLSFEIFKNVEVLCPVIFITAYDQYAMDAFKVNSIDYLLKPVQKEELEAALNKYRQIKQSYSPQNTHGDGISIDNIIKELQQKLQPKEYRKRFLVKHAQKLVSIEIDDIAYFFSDGRLNFFKTYDNRKFVVDYTMDELEDMLDPEKYFRISRSFYVSVECIDKIDDYFGNRLILQLKPAVDKEALVSREKVTDFKKWMGK